MRAPSVDRTTLVLGSGDTLATLPDLAEEPEMTPARSLVDFVFGDAGIPMPITDEVVATCKPKVIEWIRTNTLCLEEWDAKCLDEVERIQVTLETSHIARQELDDLKVDFDAYAVKIEKARSTLASKWRTGSIAYGTTTGPNPLDVKLGELNEWAQGKLADAKLKLSHKQTFITNLDKKLDSGIMALLRNMKGPEDSDPECDLLMKELEERFGELGVSPEGHRGSQITAPELNAPTVALQKALALRDGPEKKSLLGDLEAAVTTPAEAHLVTKMFPWGVCIYLNIYRNKSIHT